MNQGSQRSLFLFYNKSGYPESVREVVVRIKVVLFFWWYVNGNTAAAKRLFK